MEDENEIYRLVDCSHTITKTHEGERGSWCKSCGVKVYEVDTRKCGECINYKKDSLDLSGKVGICERHLMRVLKDMNVTYKIEEGTCWSDIKNIG